MLIGLTGSLGSGKSTVAGMLADLGAAVIDADAIARRVVQAPGPVFDAVRKAFGQAFVGPDGQLDRARLADAVFGDEERRRELEAIVHPAVRKEMRRRIEALQAQGAARPIIVLDVPLLFEGGLNEEVDRVIVTTVSDAARLERLAGRDGLDEEEVRRRMRAQWPQDEKVARADHVIDNSGSPEECRRQVEELFEKLKAKDDLSVEKES